MFDAIDNLPQDQHYVFKFWYSLPFHWNMQDTSIELTGYENSKSSTDFVNAGLPYEYEVVGGKKGNYVKLAITNGRIVEVQRWNTYFLGRPICTFTLDQGGSKRTSESAVANEVDFNVYSEEACQYLESVLPYGLELKISYTVAYATIDGNSHFAHKITVDRIPNLPESTSTSIISTNIDAQTKKLLADPAFQSQLDALVKQYWKEHNSGSNQL